MNFPGGYLSIGINLGKSNNKVFFWDAQITAGIVLLGPYHRIELPGYIFIGTTIGRRFKQNKKIIYYDIQANLYFPLQLGYGKGHIFVNNEKYLRTKKWIGLPFPILRTYDNYTINDQKIINKGFMGIIPIPIFGKYLYP